ncbi:fatty-acid amide hydrolase 2-like isoform X2 [Artemia franciscana]|uniref:fatty-acid amide hydrolase 2-like isoform X2 n=1 Tax=Artemia franciscana TaxID=6661 RepID=UPI0032DB4028
MKRFTKILFVVFRILFRTWDLAANFIFQKVIYPKPKRELPDINDLILLDSATSLAAKIRHRKITSVEVVKSFIKRIEAVNPLLNAVVDKRYEEALKDAEAADELLSSGKKTFEELEQDLPFLGVPFTTKVSVAVEGMALTAGLVKRKNMRAKKDAHTVAILRKAGAIPLANTNVSELCMWWESSNNVHGRTNNAYDQNRIVGGSSGGEACLQSAAASPMGMGSDIGGSIRMPCFFNGVFGHKASTGIVSNHGQEPEAMGDLDTFMSTGPIVRNAVDLMPLFKLLAGPNVSKLQLDKKVDLSQIKIYYMEHDGGFPFCSKVDSDIKDAIQRAIGHFRCAYNIKASRGSVNLYWELCKWFVGMSENTLPSLGLGLSEIFKRELNHPETQKFLSMCNDLKREFQALLGDNGIFMYPTHPTAAPYHNQPLCRPFNFSYTAIFNVLGLPATQVPMGIGQNGVPVGLQVVGALYMDHLTIAAACELEKSFGGWVSPSKISC